MGVSKKTDKGAVTWKTGNTCAYYVRSDEISLQGEMGILQINTGDCSVAAEVGAYAQATADAAGWDEAGFLERNPTMSHLNDDTATKYQELVDSKTTAEKDVIKAFTEKVYKAEFSK